MNQPAGADLKRFLDAQAIDFEVALQELVRGRKQSHWIWYIFPQVAGLGHSFMAQEYAIRSKAEAVAYLQHDELGRRLQECAAALLMHRGRRIADIMGHPDDMKLRSSMTLFATVSEPESLFAQVLDHFYAGEPDPRTVEFLEHHPAQ